MKTGARSEIETTSPVAIRRAAAAKLAALGKESEALEGRRRELAALTKQRDDLARDLAARRIDLVGTEAYLGAAIREQEALLITTAPAEVTEAEAFFSGKVAALRRPGAVRLGGGPEDNNLEEVGAALRYCQNALRQLAAMKLRPEPPAAAAIAELKAGLPRIDRDEIVLLEEPVEAGP